MYFSFSLNNAALENSSLLALFTKKGATSNYYAGPASFLIKWHHASERNLEPKGRYNAQSRNSVKRANGTTVKR
jgi:hypothetical protein